MAFLFQDFSKLEAFTSLSDQLKTRPADECGIEALEWSSALKSSKFRPLSKTKWLTHGKDTPTNASLVVTTVSQIARRGCPNLRVIFAPLDYPTPEMSNLLLELFRLYSVPPDFLTERIQSVTHSFGADTARSGERCAWLHFLCKNIDSDHDNPMWLRSGYFLKVDAQQNVTLLCFGGSMTLQDRMKAFSPQAWMSASESPFMLLSIVVSDLQQQLDDQVWKAAKPVGDLERHTIHSTGKADTFRQDFVSLHHVAKNIIHLKEASDAILKTISHMIRHQRDINPPNPITLSALHYQQTLLESTNLRLTSLSQRTQNIINLSFNLVAQKDSTTILAESSSMHTIALTTLIFLPISTVATIFGSQFFNYNPESGYERFSLASSFWIFWAITVPLTLGVLMIWVYFHPSTVSRWIGLRRAPKGRDQTGSLRRSGEYVGLADVESR